MNSRYFAYARQFTLCDNYFTMSPAVTPITSCSSRRIPRSSSIRRYRLPVGEPLFDLPSLPAALGKPIHLGQLWRLRLRLRQGAAGQAKSPPRSSSTTRPRQAAERFLGLRAARRERASAGSERCGNPLSATSRTACNGRSTKSTPSCKADCAKTAIFITWTIGAGGSIT